MNTRHKAAEEKKGYRPSIRSEVKISEVKQSERKPNSLILPITVAMLSLHTVVPR